jgi:chaperonin cofactor prefoldin
MLKIRALKITINTDKGIYGTPLLRFSDNLTIVKGFNSTGKSTLFQSILYGLGLEELIGGKNEKTMQSVLKSEILDNQNKIEANVIESNILLEIEGTSVVTVKRYISSETKNSGLVEVFNGKLLTEPKQYDYVPMYVHDKGAADSKNAFGFHSFLEKLMGWELPQVQYKDGSYRKLYLQNIFPSFVIEQKAGWTDFLATIPYYSLLDKETRALEFLLNLDSWKIQQRKSKLKQDKNDLIFDWRNKFNEFKSLANQIACEIRGVNNQPEIINSINSVYLVYLTEERTYNISEYINVLEEEYEELLELEVPNVGDQAEESEIRINKLNEELSNYSINLSSTINRKNLAISKYKSFKERLLELENDKVQNEYHLKVKKKGAEEGFAIAHDNCPYCSQGLNDSLLPKDIEIVPMQIEDNLEYIKAQINLIKIYMSNHQNDIFDLEQNIEKLNIKISETRSNIRTLKTQLTSDNRLPSIELIEKRLKLKARLDLYRRKYEELASFQEAFKSLSDEWVQILSEEKKLPKSLSKFDYKKISELETIFKQLLREFHYRSKPIDSISISRDTLLPVVDRYSLKFDSSASDFTRAIWSYTIALKETSERFEGNHPKLFILDEPGQQEAGDNDLQFLLKRLGNYGDTQSIVFSSFHQSEATFNACSKDVNFELIDLGEEKFIRKI